MRSGGGTGRAGGPCICAGAAEPGLEIGYLLLRVVELVSEQVDLGCEIILFGAQSVGVESGFYVGVVSYPDGGVCVVKPLYAGLAVDEEPEICEHGYDKKRRG